MNKDFERIGVWMDFENAYQSISPNFIEGVWWLIKKAHENKLKVYAWTVDDKRAAKELINMGKGEYTIVVDNTDKKFNQLAKRRCFEAIRLSGIKVDSMEPVTRDEALEHVIDGLGWRSFLKNGGMGWHYFEGRITNKKNELVGLAVVGSGKENWMGYLFENV